MLAHSNESEWEHFKNNKNNEAFLDRICVVKVPYCLRVDEEAKIYGKLLEGSDLGESPCAPEVLEILGALLDPDATEGASEFAGLFEACASTTAKA